MVFQANAKFLSVLYGSAMVVFFMPLLIFSGARLTHQNDRDNEQGDEQNRYNNNYNGQQQQYNYNQQQQGNCRWWQWSCSDNYQYQENNSRDEQDNALPWWWPWAEDERRRDPEDQANPTLVVIYIWTLLMLGGILFYAYKTVKDLRDMIGLAVSMLMLANCSFISMLYIGVSCERSAMCWLTLRLVGLYCLMMGEHFLHRVWKAPSKMTAVSLRNRVFTDNLVYSCT